MAANENQGLTIALIVFVILTIAFSVGTFMFYQSWDTATQQIATLTADNATAQQAQRTLQAEVDKLKELIGAPTTAKLEDVQGTFDQDMQQFAAAIPAENRYYRQALEYLYNVNTSTSAELVSAKDEIQALKTENESREAAKNPQIAAHQSAADQAAQDLEAERSSFNSQLQTKDQQLRDLEARANDAQQEMQTLTETQNQQTQQLNSRISLLTQTVTQQSAKIRELDPSVIIADDGEVRYVDQRSRTVWINRGEADNLRRHVTFSIFSGEESVGGARESKGRVEVTQILGPHLAEARILEDDLRQPIMRGDRLYSPVWHAGRAERFAIVGKIDIDGDGLDDRELLRNLIQINGGAIDAEVTNTGERTGTLSVDTRYVVRGAEPDEGNIEGGYTQLLNEAQELGIEQLSLERFLDHIGYTPPAQVQRFGSGSNQTVLPDRAPDGGQPRSDKPVSELFRRRLPPGAAGSTSSSGGSAY